MPAKNKQKSQVIVVKARPTKSQPKKRKQRKRGSAMRMSMGTLSDLAKSLINPFSTSACVPDGAMGVGCLTIKQTVLIGTGAAGSVCSVLIQGAGPQSTIIIETGGLTANHVITGTWSNTTASAAIISMYSMFRPVSFAIRACYVGNTQTDGGVITLAQISPGVPASTLNAATGSNLAAFSQYYVQYPLRQGGFIAWRPDSQANMEVFQTTQNAMGVGNANVNSTPWLACVVDGANPATASLLQVELVWNYEGMFSQQTFHSGGQAMTRNAPPAIGWYEKAINAAEKVAPYFPSVGAAVSSLGSLASGNYVGALGALANGYKQAPKSRGANQPRLGQGSSYDID